MKRVLGGFAAIVMLLCVVTSACASTFGRTFSELKQVVNNNVGSLTAMNYTLESGTECMIVMYETTTDTFTFGTFQYTGNGNSILSYKLYITESYTVSRATALDFVNKWNYEKRYPRAYVDDSDNTIMADGFLFMTSDCTTDMVDEFVSNMIYGTKQMITSMESDNVMP